jgi:hypothetical protein
MTSANSLLLSFLMLVAAGGALGLSQMKAGGNAEALEPLPRELEVKLALSALPPYLRSDPTVYILDPAKGYVLERQGKNEFTCFVERTDWVREDYRNDLFIPECFDAEGTRTIVPVSFDVAKLRAEGKLRPQELKKEISRRFADGVYRSPGRPGISYMLSPVQRLYGGPSSKTVHFVNMPHYMFYAPNLTSKDIGGGPVMGQYPYLINSGPHAYMVVNVGEAEKAQINRESQDLLKELCAYRSYFCEAEASVNQSVR